MSSDSGIPHNTATPPGVSCTTKKKTTDINRPSPHHHHLTNMRTKLSARLLEFSLSKSNNNFEHDIELRPTLSLLHPIKGINPAKFGDKYDFFFSQKNKVIMCVAFTSQNIMKLAQ